ncbi:MAG: hypothetical protein JWQ98_1162 [Chlorobi bacterium]|nr:hypothetical protein [Chlorobiota bacterium]
MGERFNISPAEMLHLYLDGELEPFLETGLFHSVAEDHELRAELREMLAVRSVFHRDSVGLYPPNRLTQSLMAAIAPETAVGSGNARRRGGIPLLLQRSALPLLTALLASLLTALLLWPDNPSQQYLREYSGGGILNSIIAHGATPADSRNDNIAKAIPGDTTKTENKPAINNISRQAISSGNHYSEAYRKAQSDRPAREKSHSTTNNSGSADHVASENMLTDRAAADSVPAMARIIPAPLHSVARKFTPPSFSPATPSRSLPPVSIVTDTSDPTERFVLQLRGINDKSFPAPRVEQGAPNWLDDVGLGLFYAPSEHHRFGIEAGRETFSQIFGDTEGTRRVRYEQNPTTWWIAAAYRFDPGDIGLPFGIRPFVQASAGVSPIGGIGQGSIGLAYLPERRVEFFGGIDGGILLYQLGSTIYSTRKAGWTIGTSLKF